MMKKLLVNLLALSLLISCSTAKKEDFKISGKIDGATEGKLVLEQRGNDGYVLVDTAFVENGEFVFTLKKKLPEVYYLRVDQYESAIVFFAGDSDVNINANADSLDKAVITGSIAHDQYESYNIETAKFDLKMNTIYREYKEAKEIAGLHIIRTDEKNKIGYTSIIAVDPDLKGRGIGKKLWQQAFNYWVNEKEIEYCKVPFSFRNIESFNFHLKMGFNIIEETKYIYHFRKEN